MTRNLLALSALVTTNVFAVDCLNDYFAGRLNSTQYDQCVAQRNQAASSTSSAAATASKTSTATATASNPLAALGRIFGGGSGQSALSSQQTLQLMLAYSLGFLSKDQLAQYLYWANPWQYYLLTYLYGDKAIDLILQQYQIPFYQQLFAGGSTGGNWNPWLFAAFLGQSQVR